MFLSLVAYADENWIMVDAPHTVDVAVGCQMCMGVELSSLGRMAAGTYKILLDVKWHVRSRAMFTQYGKSWSPYCDRCPETCGRLYHMGVSSNPYNTLC